MKRILMIFLCFIFLSMLGSCNTPTSQTPSKVTFGFYPQTEVTDESLLSILSQIDSTDENGYMKWNDEYYVSLVATPFSSQTKYQKGNTYYFKVEPIEWNVVEIFNRKILLSKYILDQTVFTSFDHFDMSNYAYMTKDGVPENTYANNYEYSDLREWLNTSFYHRAFNESEKENIKITTVKNQPSTTCTTPNNYACNDTEDAVFCLSYEEAMTTYFVAKPTDYAIARGCEVHEEEKEKTEWNGYASCWLRSPNFLYGYNVSAINYDGIVYNYVNCYYVGIGVCPAIQLKEF